jgi:hypothetical protein
LEEIQSSIKKSSETNCRFTTSCARRVRVHSGAGQKQSACSAELLVPQKLTIC